MAKINNDTQQVFTIIGKGTILTGDVKAQGDTRIDGELIGTINCTGRVIIGEEGKLSGDIICTNCEIMGIVEGTISTLEKTVLREKSKLLGNIKTTTLTIEAGAFFSGSCDMDSIKNNPKNEAKE